MSEMMKPGFYPKLSATEYHAVDAASKGRLSEMAPPKTPRHLRWTLDNGRVQSDCLRIGDAAHAIILEPDRFIDDYRIAGRCSAKKNGGAFCSNPGKVCVGEHWFCGVKGHAPAGAIEAAPPVVSAAELSDLKGMRSAVREHPLASEILNSRGHTECSCFWEDGETGELVKCRPDRLVEWRGDTVVDVKSCVDASPDGFGKAVRRFMYHLQAAIYCEGVCMTLGKLNLRFVFIAVEKKPPYAVAVYEVPSSVRLSGAQLYRDLLNSYHECRITGKWPGYDETMQELVLPAWATQNEVELEIGGVALTL